MISWHRCHTFRVARVRLRVRSKWLAGSKQASRSFSAMCDTGLVVLVDPTRKLCLVGNSSSSESLWTTKFTWGVKEFRWRQGPRCTLVVCSIQILTITARQVKNEPVKTNTAVKFRFHEYTRAHGHQDSTISSPEAGVVSCARVRLECSRLLDANTRYRQYKRTNTAHKTTAVRIADFELVVTRRGE